MIYKAFQIKLVYKLRLEGFDYMTAYMFASANQVYSALESIQVSSSLNSYFFCNFSFIDSHHRCVPGAQHRLPIAVDCAQLVRLSIVCLISL